VVILGYDHAIDLILNELRDRAVIGRQDCSTAGLCLEVSDVLRFRVTVRTSSAWRHVDPALPDDLTYLASRVDGIGSQNDNARCRIGSRCRLARAEDVAAVAGKPEDFSRRSRSSLGSLVRSNIPPLALAEWSCASRLSWGDTAATLVCQGHGLGGYGDEFVAQ
jgi:hypothetical protein